MHEMRKTGGYMTVEISALLPIILMVLWMFFSYLFYFMNCGIAQGIMEEAVQKELVSAGDFAVLTDRIRMRECKPQKYGTQSYTITVDGRQVIYIWPVEDAKMLHELRNEIGVGDIDSYIQVLKATAGCEVIYDPELTVHQMKKMGLLKNKKGTI